MSREPREPYKSDGEKIVEALEKWVSTRNAKNLSSDPSWYRSHAEAAAALAKEIDYALFVARQGGRPRR